MAGPAAERDVPGCYRSHSTAPGKECRGLVLSLGAAQFRGHDALVREDELLELIDHGKLAELYDIVTFDDVAEAWLAHLREPTEVGKDRYWWAVQLLYDDPDVVRRRSVILALIDKARDEDELGAVAAGPLEGNLSNNESTLRWAEDQARASQRFRLALRWAYVWDLGDAAFARLEAAAGVELEHPDRAAYERWTSDEQ